MLAHELGGTPRLCHYAHPVGAVVDGVEYCEIDAGLDRLVYLLRGPAGDPEGSGLSCELYVCLVLHPGRGWRRGHLLAVVR